MCVVCRWWCVVVVVVVVVMVMVVVVVCARCSQGYAATSAAKPLRP